MYGVYFEFRFFLEDKNIGYSMQKRFCDEPCIVSVGICYPSMREVEAMKIGGTFSYNGHDDEE